MARPRRSTTPTRTATLTAAAALLAFAPAAGSQQTGAWRALDPARTLHVELPGGTVVIELAAAFAPAHVANLRALVEARFFDGAAVVRSQDNYVAQWGAVAERPLGSARAALAPEFDRPAEGLDFTPLPDGDVYAPEVGFVDGFPAARDPATGRAWLVHCYGTVAVARGNDPGSGSGASLYAVTGHAPRHLDRNATVVGRVVRGMGVLSTLPRGSGALGFYEGEEAPVPIRSVRFGDGLPPGERARLEIMRTDGPAFRERIEARRNRTEEWFVHPAGRVGVCNVGVPVRNATPEPAGGR